MKIFYDTEFHEDGTTIDLISIGMVREDGKEFYAVSREFDTWRVSHNDWLMKNVMPSIGHEVVGDGFGQPMFFWVTDEARRTRQEIRDGILDFLSDVDEVELWAWFGAYDHVAFCQLWGPMKDLPAGLPWYTHDIRQHWESKGCPELPRQPGGHHNALEDARFNKIRYDFLDAIIKV